MPVTDKYNEILIVIIAVIVVFLIITSVIVFILLYFQKRKFRHKQDIADLEKKFSEELLRSQLEIQEQIFGHISGEIHDNVGQILSLAKIQVNVINESNEMDRNMLNEVKDNIGKAMTDLRDIARSLSSERIRNLTIHEAVTDEAERINKSGILLIRVQIDGQPEKMEDPQKLILFRIIQEGLQNIIKHAAATAVVIAFDYTPGNLRTSIKDNGKGFDPEKINGSSAGLGLANMTRRARLAGGNASIESAPDQGTVVLIDMPYIKDEQSVKR